jgi:hypothetical protein
MLIFHSYVKLPEGNHGNKTWIERDSAIKKAEVKFMPSRMGMKHKTLGFKHHRMVSSSRK